MPRYKNLEEIFLKPANMKNIIALILLLISFTVSSQSIFGKWISVDENGLEKSVVEVYEEDGKVFGKIVDILIPEDKDALCTKCKDEEYNQPVLGLMLIKNLRKDGKYYRGGTIFHPEKGKLYKCRLSLAEDNPDILEVRGYVAFLYATQYWKRVK